MYHGGGGFIHSEVYNMPTWLRRFHIQKINEHHKQQKEEYTGEINIFISNSSSSNEQKNNELEIIYAK